MKAFFVTTTETHAEKVMTEILRVDEDATISHRRENKTLLLVRSNRVSEWTLEALDGVAHAVSLSSLGKKTA